MDDSVNMKQIFLSINEVVVLEVGQGFEQTGLVGCVPAYGSGIGTR